MKSEFEFIKNLRKDFNLSLVGDDCAVIPKDDAFDLVITTDLLVEEIDFRRKWMNARFLGHKALAVSLSDIAAMGAKPVWAMLSIGIPESVWKTDFVERFYAGWFELAKTYNVELVGGDVSKTPDKIVIDSIAAGEVAKGRAVRRSGANTGDLIFVTGSLGGARCGLKLLEEGSKIDDPETADRLVRKQLRPEPRTALGQVLCTQNIATAMIDLSDGLSGDLGHICRESKKGAKIIADQIPVESEIRRFLSENLDIFDFALNGGEDFELLFTADPNISKNIFEEILQAEKVEISCIGEITETPEIIELIIENEVRKLTPKGFQHFDGFRG